MRGRLGAGCAERSSRSTRSLITRRRISSTLGAGEVRETVPRGSCMAADSHSRSRLSGWLAGGRGAVNPTSHLPRSAGEQPCRRLHLLVVRHVAQVLGDVPAVAEGILQLAVQLTPEAVFQRLL